MITLNISLHFLEPFRLLEWHEPDRRSRDNARWQRGQTFARLHMDKVTEMCRPFLAGTLLRSAVLRAVEEELARPDSPWDTCGGLFFTDGNDKPKHLRHRATTGKTGNEGHCQTREDACPLCLLLGRFDKAGKGAGRKEAAAQKFDTHFSNLSLPDSLSKRDFFDLCEIGFRRTINRVDDHTGKAHDFFSIWEIDAVGDFFGTITLADDLPNSDKVSELLQHALGFIDRLCGARCVVTVKDTVAGDEVGRTLSSPSPHDPSIAKSLPPMPYAKMRTLADAVRNLRQANPDTFFLPLGRGDQDGCRKEHYVWDILLTDKRTLRDALQGLAGSCNGDRKKWRRICEEEGQAIYEKCKDLTNSPPSPGRHLGAAEQTREPKKPLSYNGRSISTMVPEAEWIVTGTLQAATPFAVGMDAPVANDQTSSRTLVDREGRYRMPRSTLRGILRRDLSLASGDQGCRTDLGPERPCVCPVCRILRGVTVADTVSDCAVPADIRQRIHRNPVTGTVADGALFDTEAGPRGACFPFILRYRGNSLPNELETVLAWWLAGKCFIGGDGGVGRGRFGLQPDLALYRWNLSNNDARQVYAAEHGLRGGKDQKDEAARLATAEISSLVDQTTSLKSAEHLSPFPWQPREWTWSFTGPLLQGDPLAALNTDSSDVVSYARTVLKDDKPNREYVLRGEGLRGLLRTAVGRATTGDLLTRDHQDCTCELCQLFGSEHKTGILRIEDAVPAETQSPPIKRLDHVSIDRFDQSVVEKYDDRPLVGSPEKPLRFTGCFWTKTEKFDDKLKNLIDQAFRDIGAGLYPVGGKNGIGYGKVSSLTIDKEELTAHFTSSADLTVGKTLPTGEATVLPFPRIPPTANDAVFYPYYFLAPPQNDGPAKNREAEIIGHHTFHAEKHTGRIICTLTSRSPLLLPDHDTDQGETATVPVPGHRTLPLFTLNGQHTIPAAAIRAAVSQVYETVTNSCFRVMNQKRSLSWRMDTNDHLGKTPGHTAFQPGRISKDGEHIEVMKAARLPLYDAPDIYKTLDQLMSDCTTWEGRNKEYRIEVAREVNRYLAAAADKNRALLCFLSENEPEKYKHILDGQAEVSFHLYETHPNFKHDIIAVLGNTKPEGDFGKYLGLKMGYIKFTGFNNANVESTTADATPSPNDSAPFARLLDQADCLNSTQKHYARPKYQIVLAGLEYTVTKRCERVYYPAETQGRQMSVILPARARREYENQIQVTRKNTNHICEAFRSILPEKLTPGTLVYFRSRENHVDTADAVVPVSLFRLQDDRVLGRRLPDNYQPCSHVCLQGCEPCEAINSPLPLYREGYPIHGLCPACRLFGSQMYKGRVRFGFAWPDQEVAVRPGVLLPQQNTPRPTWVLPKNVRNTDTRIPGRKFYLRHEGWKEIYYNKRAPSNSLELTTTAIEANQTFRFQIHFENLTAQELGLLLYCLELEKGMVHAIGHGKPFGFGQVTINVADVESRLPTGSWQKWPLADSVMHREIVANALDGLAANDHPWYTLSHLVGLRILLTRHPDIRVRYPSLTKEEKSGLMTYSELKEFKKKIKKNGRDVFVRYSPALNLTVRDDETKASDRILPWHPLDEERCCVVLSPPPKKNQVRSQNCTPSVGMDCSGPPQKKIPSAPVDSGSSTTDKDPALSTGRIKKVIADRGFGFIEPDQRGVDTFFHVNNFITTPANFAALEERRVSYTMGIGKNGKPTATGLTLLDEN